MTQQQVHHHNVQGLRAIAALMIIGVHFSGPDGFVSRYLDEPDLLSWLHEPGNAGVDLFFVISGFIMTVTTSRLTAGTQTAGRFLLRRAARIYPVYWIVTTLILAIYLVRPEMVNANSEQAPQILPSYLLLPQTGAPLLLVGWTLVYEMFFYAIFALGLLIGRRYLPVLLVAWALALVAARLVLGRPDDPWISFLTNPINLEFLFGVTIGYLTIRGRLRAPRTAVAVGLIAALAVWTVQVNQGREASGEWFRALCVGGAMAVIIYGVVALELANGRRFPKLMHQLGDASYSIYLWHLLALKALGLVLEKIVPDHSAVHVVSAALSFAVIVAACVIAYRVIEDPLMRGLRNRIPKPNAQYIKVRRFE